MSASGVQAKWTAEIISPRRLAQIELLSHNYDLPDLMLFERGNTKDGGAMPMRVAGQEGSVGYETKNIPDSGYFMLSIRTDSPPRIGEQVKINFNELRMMSFDRVGRQAGSFMCAKQVWVVAETTDGETVAVQPDSLERLRLSPSAGRPIWDARRAVIGDVEGLYITDVSIGGGSRMVRCVDNHVSSAAVVTSGDNIPVFLLAAGDARSDGKRRFYGVSGSDRTFVEGTIDSSERFHPLSRLSLENIGDISQIAIGDARNEGRNRLYVSGSRGLVELSWDGAVFRQARIDGEERQGAFAEFTSGLMVGSFRDDGKNRIYLANGNVVSEYSFTRKKWARIEFRPLDQRIYSMIAIPWIRPSQRLVLLGDDSGAYYLKWADEGWTAVAPFVGSNGVTAEGEAVAEIVRQYLIEQGNCRVLEREKLSSILAEQKVQMSRLIDPKTTVATGKLIGAGQVIVGRVESLYGDYFVAAKSVNTENGSISRQQFIEVRGIPELKTRIQDLSFGICTGRSE